MKKRGSSSKTDSIERKIKLALRAGIIYSRCRQTRDVYLAGDDAGAKHLIAQLFESGGLKAIDVGPLRRARELEAAGYLGLAARISPEAASGSVL